MSFHNTDPGKAVLVGAATSSLGPYGGTEVYTPVFTVISDDGQVATASFEIRVHAILVITGADSLYGAYSLGLLLGQPFSYIYPTDRGITPSQITVVPSGQSLGSSGQYEGLPPGMSLNPATGVLSGTLNHGGYFVYGLKITDATGTSYTTYDYINVGVTALSFAIAPPNGQTGVAYSYTVPVATGGNPPYVYSAASLPAWASFDAATRTISGVPTPGNDQYMAIEVTDDLGNFLSKPGYANFGFAPMSITGTFPNGSVGLGYNASVAVSGGDGNYQNLTILTGTIPPGLALSILSGSLSLAGTPTTGGSYAFTAQVSDGSGLTAITSQTVTTGALSLVDTILADNPIAYWPLDEATGTTFRDLSGNGHTATVDPNPAVSMGVTALTASSLGLPPLRPGAKGSLSTLTRIPAAARAVIPGLVAATTNCANFSMELFARSDRNDLGQSSSFLTLLGLNPSFTDSVGIKNSSLAMRRCNDGGQSSSSRTVAYGGITNIIRDKPSPDMYAAQQTTAKPSVDDGHFLTLTRSASAVKFYLDGTLVVTKTLDPATAPPFIDPSDGTVRFLGSETNPTLYSATGSVSDVALFLSTLSDAQVAAHYAAYRKIPGTWESPSPSMLMSADQLSITNQGYLT